MELPRALYIIQDKEHLLQLLKEAMGHHGNLAILEQYLNLLTWNHQVVQILGVGEYPDQRRILFPNGYAIIIHERFLKSVGDPIKRDKKHRGKAVKSTVELVQKNGGKNGKSLGRITLDSAKGWEVRGELEPSTEDPGTTTGDYHEGWTGDANGQDNADHGGEDQGGEPGSAAGNLPLDDSTAGPNPAS